jgi:hypothetical protein
VLTRPDHAGRRRPFGWFAVLAVAVLAVSGLLPASPAQAQSNCRLEFGTGPNGEEVLIWTCGDGWGGGGGDGGLGSCQAMIAGRPMQVHCFDDRLGWFTPLHGGCYIQPMNPQPAADDPVWDGHSPEEGLIYLAACFAVDLVDGHPYTHLPIPMFFPAGEGTFGDLIEQVIALLPMSGAEIGIAPDPSGTGLVGLPVWMWTAQTPESWGPLEASLTALGLTVHAEANATAINWDMGDGTTRVCSHPGTPYQAEYAADPSPTCGHTYLQPSRNQPGEVYPITATTEWRIDWWIEGTAISGVETRTRTSSTTVRINELQVVTS